MNLFVGAAVDLIYNQPARDSSELSGTAQIIVHLFPGAVSRRRIVSCIQEHI